MEASNISLLVTALIALLCSAFFSGLEIAFVSSNKVRAEIEMARGGIINRILNVYYRNREMFLSTLLIGNTFLLFRAVRISGAFKLSASFALASE